jgi:hypothetical protein
LVCECNFIATTGLPDGTPTGLPDDSDSVEQPSKIVLKCRKIVFSQENCSGIQDAGEIATAELKKILTGSRWQAGK